MVYINNNIVKIDNALSSIVLDTSKSNVELLYIGKKISDYNGTYLETEYKGGGSINDNILYSLLYSFSGDGSDRECGLMLHDKSGQFVYRFVFDRVETVSFNNFNNMPYCRNKKETVKISYKCLNENLLFNVYISTFSNSGVFSFSTELVNNGDNTIIIDRIMSLQLEIFTSEEKVYTFDGTWTRERHITENDVKSGVFYVDSKSGVSSAFHNPFVMMKSKDYGYFAFNLVYSGNHKEIFEHSIMNTTRVLTGINDYNFHYELNGGEKFSSPEAIVVNCDSTDEITSEMHKFVMENIINENYRFKERPVLINTWEGSGFSINKDLLIKTGEVASELGIELMVVDDGWFGNRDSSMSGLGDWVENKDKTGGLKELKEYLKKKNVGLGIWIEPEMINKDSDLYRKHPEFVMQAENLQPIERRNQLMLDLANDEVVDYVLKALFKIFDELQPDYIKWDYNRIITDAYSRSLKNQGEYYHRYILGSYRMYAEMTKRYPSTLFEGCSSGGNRFDLGMLFYVPQIWCSDDTDALERIFIQEGTLYGYPHSTVGAHVTAPYNHSTNRSTYISSRFNIACLGAFGYESDLTKLSDNEKIIYKNQIKFYKVHRKLLQFGSYYRLGDIFNENNGGYIIISDDKKEAIAVVVQKNYVINQNYPRFTFKGLNKDERYEVSKIDPDTYEKQKLFVAGGDILMTGKINLGKTADIYDKRFNNNPVYTKMIYFKQI